MLHPLMLYLLIYTKCLVFHVLSKHLIASVVKLLCFLRFSVHSRVRIASELYSRSIVCCWALEGFGT
jgi:hypothetical protein